LEATLQADNAAEQIITGENMTQQGDRYSPQENLVICDEPSFTLQYISGNDEIYDVTEDVVRNDIGAEHEPILSLVIDKTLDISRLVAAPDATVDPTLQKEVTFMNNWLTQAAVNDNPFVPVVLKSQKKKLNKPTQSAYQTRSLGPLPSSK